MTGFQAEDSHVTFDSSRARQYYASWPKRAFKIPIPLDPRTVSKEQEGVMGKKHLLLLWPS